MSQWIDLVGSYMIGGIFLLGLLALILNFSAKNQEAKLSEITMSSSDELYNVIQNDIEKVGYRVESGSKIITLNDSVFAFRTDYDNNTTVDSITYSRITDYQKAYSPDGLKKYIRKRVNPGNQEWVFPVESLNFTGLDSAGNAANALSAIRSISVSMELRGVSSDTTYLPYGAFWKRVFYPKNL